jgi:hypothetical protein
MQGICSSSDMLTNLCKLFASIGPVSGRSVDLSRDYKILVNLFVPMNGTRSIVAANLLLSLENRVQFFT